MTVFEAGKEYRTRDGRPARIYATDADSLGSIHGAVRHSEFVWDVRRWESDGRSNIERDGPNDLISPRPPVVVSDAVLFACAKVFWHEDDWPDASAQTFKRNGLTDSEVKDFRAAIAAAIDAWRDEQETAG